MSCLLENNKLQDGNIDIVLLFYNGTSYINNICHKLTTLTLFHYPRHCYITVILAYIIAYVPLGLWHVHVSIVTWGSSYVLPEVHT